MPVTFDANTRELLDGKNFATVATVNPDGGPQSSVVWYLRDGDTLLFSTTADRRKARNLARDPRISVTVYDLANPYRRIEVRGHAQLDDDTDLELPRQMYQRYLGTERPAPAAPEKRIVVRVIPDKIVGA